MPALSRPRRRIALIGYWGGLICLLTLPFRAAASKTPKELRDFDIPATDAVAALRRFATQSGAQLIYSGTAVSGVRTVVVKGKYTPRDALDRMLTGTGLSVREDQKTGAMAIMPAASSADRQEPPSDNSASKKKDLIS